MHDLQFLVKVLVTRGRHTCAELFSCNHHYRIDYQFGSQVWHSLYFMFVRRARGR